MRFTLSEHALKIRRNIPEGRSNSLVENELTKHHGNKRKHQQTDNRTQNTIQQNINYLKLKCSMMENYLLVE